MTLKVNKFVWENDPKIKVEPKPQPKLEPKADVVSEEPDNSKYIYLTEDGILKIKKSQYVEDMLGIKNQDIINKKNYNKGD